MVDKGSTLIGGYENKEQGKNFDMRQDSSEGASCGWYSIFKQVAVINGTNHTKNSYEPPPVIQLHHNIVFPCCAAHMQKAQKTASYRECGKLEFRAYPPPPKNATAKTAIPLSEQIPKSGSPKLSLD